MKRTVTTCVDVPRPGGAATGRRRAGHDLLRVEVTFDAAHPEEPEALPKPEASEDRGRKPGALRGRGEPGSRGPTPGLGRREAAQAARRIAERVAANPAGHSASPAALLRIAERVATRYRIAMRRAAPTSGAPALRHVRVVEVESRMSVDLELDAQQEEPS